MTSYLFLVMFFIVSAIHLKDSWADDADKRKKTKPFLLVLLLAFYLSAARTKSVYLILALVTSWLGDVLLIPKGNRWFAMGGISFLFSHIFFMIIYLKHIVFADVSWLMIIAASAVYLGISLWVTEAIKDNTPKIMLVPMYLYLVFNSAMNVFALMQAMTLRNAGAWIAFIGAVLFFVSDCVLFLVRYHHNRKLIFKRHFSVMLAYLSGEFLIVSGILLMGG